MTSAPWGETFFNFFKHLGLRLAAESPVDPARANTPYLTALRGYAAFGIFFIHSSGLGLRDFAFDGVSPSKAFGRLIDFGKYGVIVFFVLSAYTIALSLEKNIKVELGNYLMRRVSRVLPMYYLMITIGFFAGGIPEYFELFGVKNDWINLVTHFTFLNFWSVGQRNNLLGVEWSVPIEFAYYLVLPFAFILFRRINRFGLLTVIIGLILLRMSPLLHGLFAPPDAHPLDYHWSAVKYVFPFYAGLALFQFTKSFPQFSSQIGSGSTIALIAMLLLFAFSGFHNEEEFVALWTCFVVLAAQNRGAISDSFSRTKLRSSWERSVTLSTSRTFSFCNTSARNI